MEQKNKDNVLVERKIFMFSIFLLGILIISSIVICYFMLSDLIITSTEEIEINVDLPADDFNEDKTPAEEKSVYELKEYNGKIGVYKNDALVYTINTYVFTLPESDKSLLKEGIKVYSEDELRELIEEYY